MESLSFFDDSSYTSAELPDQTASNQRKTLLVPGLQYVPEFISAAEEERLLQLIDQAPWSSYWQRRVQTYGIRYTSHQQSDESPAHNAALPAWSGTLCQRLVTQGCMRSPANQIGVNEYLPGQGIAPHVDYHHGIVVSLTLGSGCQMTVEEIKRGRSISVWLDRRSILVIDGLARTHWKHGIARRLKDFVDGRYVARHRRVSVTFRQIGGDETAG